MVGVHAEATSRRSSKYLLNKFLSWGSRAPFNSHYRIENQTLVNFSELPFSDQIDLTEVLRGPVQVLQREASCPLKIRWVRDATRQRQLNTLRACKFQYLEIRFNWSHRPSDMQQLPEQVLHLGENDQRSCFL